jgi:Holliday junction resolvase RusA-like endonuclease
VRRSWPKWKQTLAESGELPRITTPDLDDVWKAVLNALDGVAFEDDSMVTAKTATKQYSRTPRTEVVTSWQRLPQTRDEHSGEGRGK